MADMRSAIAATTVKTAAPTVTSPRKPGQPRLRCIPGGATSDDQSADQPSTLDDYRLYMMYCSTSSISLVPFFATRKVEKTTLPSPAV